MQLNIENVFMYCKSNKELLETEAKVFKILNDLSLPGVRDEFAKYMIKIKVYEDVMEYIESNQ